MNWATVLKNGVDRAIFKKKLSWEFQTRRYISTLPQISEINSGANTTSVKFFLSSHNVVVLILF